MSWVARLLGVLPAGWLKRLARQQWRAPWLKRLYDRAARAAVAGPGVIAKGLGRGLAFDAAGSNAGYLLGTSEPHVQRALELLVTRGMTVYDVGANVGFFSVIAARLVGPTGRVVCFEPLPRNVARLERNARLNGFDTVTVRPEALGAEDGRARFLLSEVESWGRLAGTGTVDHPAGACDVPLRRLDGVIAEGVPPPDLIKLDCEGAEASVLDGGAELLGRRRPILLIELHGTNVAVAASLGRLGYRTVVLGRAGDIEGAPWNAHVVAYAPDDARVAALAPELARLTAQ